MKVNAFITNYGFTRFVNAITDCYLLAYNYQQLLELWATVAYAIALHDKTFEMGTEMVTMRAMLKLHTDIGNDLEQGNLA